MLSVLGFQYIVLIVNTVLFDFILSKFSRTTSSRSSPGCTIDMKICRTLSGSMKNDGGCESSSLLLSSSSGNNPESAGSEKIRIFDESEYVLMTNNNNAQISETIGIFDSNTID